MSKTTTGIIMCTVMMFTVAIAEAGVIRQPVSVTSSLGFLSATTVPENLINQTGLYATYTDGVTDFDSFTQTTLADNSGGGNVWAAPLATSPPADLDFDLGDEFKIDAIAIWHSPGTASITAFDLYGSLTSDFSSPVALGSFTAVEPTYPTLADIYTFSVETVRYFRIHITANNGSVDIAAAANEVVFRDADEVFSWPMFMPAITKMRNSGE